MLGHELMHSFYLFIAYVCCLVELRMSRILLLLALI